MTAERFDFPGDEGQILSGRLELPDGPVAAYALIAHCFTCTKDSVAAARIARALAARGYGVLRFDFTGLGESGGAFADSSFSGNIADIVAAARAMAAVGRVVRLLIGHSLGGAAVLAAAAALPDVRAVSTIGAPADVQHVRHLLGDGLDALPAEGAAEVSIGGRPFRLRRRFLDDLAEQDQLSRIGALHRALLVLHSPQDAIVGIDNASAIFLAARHPKSFVSLDHADHLLTRRQDADYVAEVIAAWAGRYLDSPTPLRMDAQDGAVHVEETGEGALQVEVRAGGARFLADEPVEAGGLGSGPTPYDLLCAALGACTAMTLRLYAGRKRWPLGPLRIAVGHARDAAHMPADLFTREIALAGPLDAQQRAQLLAIADRCPVHRTLSAGARIVTADADRPQPLAAADSPGAHGRAAASILAAEDSAG
jgi:putative redox protein